MTPEQVAQLFQYGVLGLVLTLIVSGPLALGRELRRERQTTDTVLESNGALASSNATLVSSNASTSAAMAAMAEEVRRLAEEVRRLQPR